MLRKLMALLADMATEIFRAISSLRSRRHSLGKSSPEIVDVRSIKSSARVDEVNGAVMAARLARVFHKYLDASMAAWQSTEARGGILETHSQHRT